MDTQQSVAIDVDTTTAVERMMAETAELNLSEPLDVVRVALSEAEESHPGVTEVFMESLLAELIRRGRDPYDRSIC